MALAFLVSTPFALLDPLHFLGDFVRQNHVVANGWLGFENVHDGYWYNLSVNLLASLGIVLLALGLVGIILALVKRTRADYVLVPYVLVYYLYVSSWHELMDRYLLPIVPLLILLAVRACVALASVPLVRRRGVVVVAAAALLLGAIVLPARASINYSRSLSGTDVRTVAKAWIEHHLPVSAVIAMEPDGPPLVSRLDLPLYSEARLTTSSYRCAAAPAPAGRRRRYARRAVPHRRRGRLCGAELRRRQEGASRGGDLPEAARVLQGSRAPRPGGRALRAAPRRARSGDHDLPAAAVH